MKRKPVICSLNEADFDGREAAWHALLETTAESCRERDDGFDIRLSPDDDTLARLQQLAALEERCCGWMNIEVRRSDTIHVGITSSEPNGKDVIRLLIPESVRQRG